MESVSAGGTVSVFRDVLTETPLPLRTALTLYQQREGRRDIIVPLAKRKGSIPVSAE